MKIGKMSHLLTLETQGTDGVWSKGVSFFASLDPVNDPLNRLATDRATHKMCTRSRTDIQTGMRVSEGSRAWIIRAVRDVDETARWIEIIAEEEKLLWG